MTKPTSEDYLLMDGRASYDTDKASVLLVGSAKEMCEDANKGGYGSDCVVVKATTMEPMWEWFVSGSWKEE